jgi:hypothetical protein
MVQLTEITDEVAEKLRVSEEPPAAKADEGLPSFEDIQERMRAAAAQAAVAGPEDTPAREWSRGKTVDEVFRELNKSPFFMTELEENADTEALRALAYEGTPLEVATDFKETGNDCFRSKKWADAREYYGKGILVLRAEERKRRGLDLQGRAIAQRPVREETDAEREAREAAETKQHESGEIEIGPAEDRGFDSPADVAAQTALLESLYGNRAACHLALQNHRSCWEDGAAALRLNPRNLKALYRSARALLAADRIAEADDACARGLELDPDNAALRAVARDIVKRRETLDAGRRREAERLARDKRRALLRSAALQARGIQLRATAEPPAMEDARLQLVPDEDDAASSLSFPTVLLYPADMETDFIKAFNEQDSIADHLAYVFPLPWDTRGEYTLAGVECYMDTISGGLIKVGKKLPLLKILSSGKVEVVDEVVRIFVVPKAKADSWVQEYKSKKAAEKGG